MKFDDDDSFIDDDSDEDRSFSSSGSSSEDDKAVSDSSGKAASSRINMQRGTRRTRAKARYGCTDKLWWACSVDSFCNCFLNLV